MSNWRWESFREGCGTCAYAGPRPPKGTQHQCRRHPPTMLVVTYPGHNSSEVEQHQPWMSETDWCGDYARDVPPKETP